MAKMIQCPKCGKPYYSSLRMCPECMTPRPKNTKLVVIITISCLAVAAVFVILGNVFRNNNVRVISPNNDIASISDIRSVESKTPKYETYAEWADLSNYMFAVEVDDFDGDIFEAGDYRFYVQGESTNPQDVFVVWDVYISDNCYDNIRQLNKNELKASVGGNAKTEQTIHIEKGKYVYIKYNETVGNPKGILCIEKQ